MKARTIASLATIVFMWGVTFPLVKISVAEVPPITLAFLRFLLASPIMVLYSHLRDKDFKSVFARNLAPLAVMGLTGIMGYEALQNIGVELTSATESSILTSSTPIMIALLAAPFLKENLTRKHALGIVLGFAGVMVIVLPQGGDLSVNTSSLVGNSLNLLAAFSWAIYSVIGRRLATRYTPTGLTAASTLLGTVFLIPPMCLLETPSLPTSIQVWLALVVLSLGATCLAYTLWNQVLSEEEASKSGVALFAVPLVAAIASITFLSESVTPSFVVGAALVLAGIVLAERD
jgi:drug/metabolite transporter (DMT)-like permease